MGDPDVPVAMRTMSLARTFLGGRRRLTVGLDAVLYGGEYAFCDGGADSVAWDKRIVCFEMSALKGTPAGPASGAGLVFSAVGGAVVYRAIRCGSWSTRPAGCWEFRGMLSQMEEWLKTRAKLKVGPVDFDAGNGRPPQRWGSGRRRWRVCPSVSCSRIRRR